MPLTEKGEKIKSAMTEEYGPEKGEEVFYASKNKGTISGVDQSIPPEGGAMPTPTPTQSPSPPSAEKPVGILPSTQPAPTNPVSVNAYKELPTGPTQLDGPTNRLVPGDTGRQVGRLADYARAAGRR